MKRYNSMDKVGKSHTRRLEHGLERETHLITTQNNATNYNQSENS